MLLNLLANGQVAVFVMIMIAIVLSLSFHEFGHAFSAKLYGDDTAQRLGRLTINPIPHIDPIGLLMFVLVGIGYAKPVPFDPRNFKSVWGIAGVALAGPLANLIVAFVVINFFSFAHGAGWAFTRNPDAQQFLQLLVIINLILMIFNLIPLGVLDGHHILPYFLPKTLAAKYRTLNAKYGMFALLGLLLVSYVQDKFGWTPILSYITQPAGWIAAKLTVL